MQVTYRYYDAFNLMHTHLSKFMKDSGLEGIYHWRYQPKSRFKRFTSEDDGKKIFEMHVFKSESLEFCHCMHTYSSTSLRSISYQVVVGRYPWETFANNRPDNDCWNKSAFEAMLASVESEGEDPKAYITD